MRILLLFLLLAGCKEEAKLSKELNLSLKSLMGLYGQPDKIIESKRSKGSFLYLYPNNLKFQIENKSVTAVFRDPDKFEKSIQYWRHLLNKFPYTIVKGNEEFLSKLNCPIKGLDILFDNKSGQVVRVINYNVGGEV